MQDSSAFQYLAIDLIDVSTTNPRRSFDEGKLQELAEGIRQFAKDLVTLRTMVTKELQLAAA